MNRAELDHVVGDDAWARIARDPRLASAIDSVRRVSGLPTERVQRPAIAPRSGDRPAGATRGDGTAAHAPPADPPRTAETLPRRFEARPAARARPAQRPAAEASHRPTGEAPRHPVPPVRARRLGRREGIVRHLVLAAAVALLLHVAVFLALGGGGAMIRATLEHGLRGFEVGRLTDGLAGPGTAMAAAGSQEAGAEPTISRAAATP